MDTKTNNRKPHLGQRFVVLAFAAWLCSVTTPTVHAQLAITEVMSDAATNCAGAWNNIKPDFWELTNYGTNSIDLTGYRFYDSGGVSWLSLNPLPSTSIAPGESIVFVRKSDSVLDAQAFVEWWGAANLPTNLQIYVGGNTYPGLDGREFYPGPGFDGEGGDAVRLWDAQSNLVDEVHFDQAVLDKGITFVADPKTGEFGLRSRTNVCGAFEAAQCDDIGSPGFAPCGPIGMFITRQPVSQAVHAGSSVRFLVEGTGLPRPRGYEWYHDGVLIPSPKVLSDAIPLVVNYAGCGLAWNMPPRPNVLVISNVQPDHAGEYYVVLTNGLQYLTSAVVTLTVSTNPIAPQIECPSEVWWFPPLAGQRQTNLIVSDSQPAILDVHVRAYPPPTFRWSWSADGTTFQDISETNRSLAFTRVSADDAGTYRVCVQNKLGTNCADATLTVRPKPQLRITEAMSDECQSTSLDWWELTNTGDEPVNVTGYRWDDAYPYEIGGGPTITNAVIIQPGESVILLESQSRASFFQWWGEENLPPRLQCIVYRGNGLGETADIVRLWGQSASDNGDFINSVSFSRATKGASFWFDPALCAPLYPDVVCPECGKPSVESQCGVFRAAAGCDLGSPGWTRWTPPFLTAITQEESVVRLTWKAQPGSTNRVQYAPGADSHVDREASGNIVLTWAGTGTLQQAAGLDVWSRWTDVPGAASGYTAVPSAAMQFFRVLATPPGVDPWTDLGTYTFPGATGTATNTLGTNQPWFYRILRVSPAACTCPEDL